MAADRVRVALPADHEVERATLGLLLWVPSSFREHNIPGEWFHNEAHRKIYAAMCEIQDETSWLGPESQIDLPVLRAKLAAQGELESVGGVAYLAGLDLQANSSALPRYLEVLRDRFLRRSLIKAADRAADGAAAHERLELVVPRLQRELLEIVAGGSRGEEQAVGLVAHEILDRVTTMSPGSIVGHPTGLRCIDNTTGGLRPGQQWTIGGRPGHGKTALIKQVSLHLARQKIPVGGLSLEMTATEITDRLLAEITGIPPRRFNRGEVNAFERDDLRRAANSLATLPITINDSVSPNLPALLAAARQMVSQKGVKVLWIDHIQRVRVPGLAANPHREVGLASNAFAALAKELQVTTVILSQLSRGQNGDDCDPTLARLRESGDLEADAHVVVFVHRPEASNPVKARAQGQEGVAKIIVAKNRDGSTGFGWCRFDGPKTKFTDEEGS